MLKMLTLKGAKSEIMENVSTVKYFFFKDTYFFNVEINNTHTHTHKAPLVLEYY